MNIILIINGYIVKNYEIILIFFYKTRVKRILTAEDIPIFLISIMKSGKIILPPSYLQFEDEFEHLLLAKNKYILMQINCNITSMFVFF